MKRWLIWSAVVYVVLMAFCGLGARAIPASTQQLVRPYLWLLGPPANLVYGTDFLWPFAIGTIVVAGLLFGIARFESPGVRIACGSALVIAWAVFGFIVYAPGA